MRTSVRTAVELDAHADGTRELRMRDEADFASYDGAIQFADDGRPRVTVAFDHLNRKRFLLCVFDCTALGPRHL
jgi:hypothetical protein